MCVRNVDRNVFISDTENTVVNQSLIQEENPQMLTLNELKDKLKEELTTFKTRTWLIGYAPLSDDPEYEDCKIFNNIDDFMLEIRQGGLMGKLIYYHNLAYDGPQIVDHLFKMGYHVIEPEYSKEEKGLLLPEFGFYPMISKMGQWYSIKIGTPFGITEIRDSFKILPFKLDEICQAFKTKYQKLVGTIDYTKPRPDGYEPTEEELLYFKHDLLGASEALYKIRKEGVTELTIGSHAFKMFKNMGFKGRSKKETEENFRAVFPELDTTGWNDFDAPLNQESQMRKAYWGAITYNNVPEFRVDLTDKQAEKNLSKIPDFKPLTWEEKTLLSQRKLYMYKIDVNSLYPSVMYQKKNIVNPIDDHPYPSGKPRVIENEDEWYKVCYSDHAVGIVHGMFAFKVKDGHFPFLQEKSGMFGPGDFIREVKNPREFTFTEVDFKQLCKHYDITYFEFLNGWYFKALRGIFNKFIEYWYEEKKRAKGVNPVRYMLAKLMLNNLYGKFAQSPVRESNIPYFEDNEIKFNTIEKLNNTSYIPLGAFITAYARRVTTEMIQGNWGRFIYGDTDSGVILGKPQGVVLGTEIGEWDLEEVILQGKFVRAKTYITYGVDPKHYDGTQIDETKLELHLKACGAPEETKTRLLYKVSEKINDEWYFHPFIKDANENILNEKRSPEEIMDRFTKGLVEAGKLTKRVVDGGKILYPTTFAIL